MKLEKFNKETREIFERRGNADNYINKNNSIKVKDTDCLLDDYEYPEYRYCFDNHKLLSFINERVMEAIKTVTK